VALTPQCAECNAVRLSTDETRWQAYWIDAGPQEELIFYCARCAEREFGGD
jgi:hypothetical protein